MNDFIPSEFYLGQNYPNPFKDRTTIKYCVAQKTRVKLIVYDANGKEIEILVDEEKQPGTYKVEFNIAHSTDDESSPVINNKIYYYCLEAGGYSSEKKMELIK